MPDEFAKRFQGLSERPKEQRGIYLLTLNESIGSTICT